MVETYKPYKNFRFWHKPQIFEALQLFGKRFNLVDFIRTSFYRKFFFTNAIEILNIQIMNTPTRLCFRAFKFNGSYCSRRNRNVLRTYVIVRKLTIGIAS